MNQSKVRFSTRCATCEVKSGTRIPIFVTNDYEAAREIHFKHRDFSAGDFQHAVRTFDRRLLKEVTFDSNIILA